MQTNYKRSHKKITFPSHRVGRFFQTDDGFFQNYGTSCDRLNLTQIEFDNLVSDNNRDYLMLVSNWKRDVKNILAPNMKEDIFNEFYTLAEELCPSRNLDKIEDVLEKLITMSRKSALSAMTEWVSSIFG